MIKSLSPYYLNIPFVSPLTGATCTAYKLNIFVWNGLKTAVPVTPVYSVTKTNPTNSVGSDKVNISRLVNDYIDFMPAVGTVTGLYDGENQRWCQTSVEYTTTNPIDTGVKQLKTTTLVLKGFGYGMEGENAQPPTNKILLNGGEFKVNRTGVFNLPILINEPASSINAVNDVFDIYFQDSFLNVLNNDNLGFTPTEIIQITSTMPSSVGSLSIDGSQIKFTKGDGVIITPQSFSYTIQDVLLNQSTANVVLNILEVPVLPVAVNDNYTLNNEDAVDLFPMLNDALGVTPTTITAINTTNITTGTITIEGAGSKLTFIPNGLIASGQTMTYTITDSDSQTSTGTITLNVEEPSPLITEYFTAEGVGTIGEITYKNIDNEIISINILSNECVGVSYLEIISTFNLINCTP